VPQSGKGMFRGVVDALRWAATRRRPYAVSESRRRQLELDLATLAVLLMEHSEGVQWETDPENERFTQVVEKSAEEHGRIVGDLARSQAAEMLVAMSEASDVETLQRRQSAGVEDGSVTTFGRPRAFDAVDARLQVMEEILLEKVGMVPEVAPSTIDHPEAGQGVFMRGNAPAGKVAALYPGIVYFPFQVQEIQDARFRRGDDDPAAMKRYADLFLMEDGSPNMHITQLYDGTTINAKEGSVSRKANVFAVGHKVNHPPKGLLPNVMLCPFTFTGAMMKSMEERAQDVNDYIPNKLIDDPQLKTIGMDWILSRKDELLRSLAYVAIREIEDGEELFINYRYDPKLDESLLPDWYEPVDPEGDKLRWS